MAASAAENTPVADLKTLLAEVSPFSALPLENRTRMAEAAEITTYQPGDLILDGFHHPATGVYLVMKGKVGIWQEVEAHGHPDDTLRTGGFCGFSAMLTGRTVGPRARALTKATIAFIPRHASSEAFLTSEGAQFITNHLLTLAEKTRQLPGFATTGSLIDQSPTVVDDTVPLVEVARELTQRRQPGVVVRRADGTFGLVTDGSIRRCVLAEGLPVTATAGEALARDVPTVQIGDSAGESLTQILTAKTEAAIVTDKFGDLRGVVGLREFSLSPTTADVALHEQLRLAASREELIQRSRQTPAVLSGLLSQGLAGAQVIRVHSGFGDAIVRRALELCLEEHPDLSMDGFTWLTLGSNGRRETALSSDMESAVVFLDDTDLTTRRRYRALFADVESLLEQAGFAGDDNGVSARRDIMSRTASAWQRATKAWLASPHENQGAIMISLFLDSRAVFGDVAAAAASFDLHQLRSHPATLRLLLGDALSQRPHARRHAPVFRREATFDIKKDALRPLVNLARWLGLAMQSTELSTADRLRAAEESFLLAPGQGTLLAEGFEVLQRVRLRSQIAQVQAGKPPTNTMRMSSMSPFDRSVLAEVVHEIIVAQRRLANVAAWSDTDDWRPSPERS
ncbi:putative nucleotidyltransferase substrate binding domain-containing protein [Dermatophilus congolensis]|uniref:putative nucleotidyltransferase substrate binding domain-containing protein n=1 Tax=Dermatophilus congolensis TaxID=1863 RepID=UPI001AAF5C7F|nr:putative nucleotidyltransferase substrate binding domain-containing protein [Dermatophilus congolensis]MBO3142025.1 histidine kinase [Dermatophilus congolensis]MBO3151016.1 histidine kinase [Dermatophilus congolensis]MBO3161979.1 histidine kinase [Dermatophilus congolensis]MBO3162300.1 histidine kinase [Dermatophilus congolensis]MBO3175854.1 histidine kinase [Dermatophilus congolensis]